MGVFAEARKLAEHEFLVMTPEDGHIKTVWDPEVPEEVEAAKEQFEKLRKKGYQIFHVNKKGDPAEIMTKFDPEAHAIIAAPQPVGG